LKFLKSKVFANNRFILPFQAQMPQTIRCFWGHTWVMTPLKTVIEFPYAVLFTGRSSDGLELMGWTGF
jgi:hypothetical protein